MKQIDQRQDYFNWINKRARLARKNGTEVAFGANRSAFLILACKERGLSDDETFALMDEQSDMIDKALTGKLKTVANMKCWFDLVESKLLAVS